MKLDFTTHNEETILCLRRKIIGELETFCNERLIDIISTSDLRFFFHGSEIRVVNEENTLETFVNQV